MVGTGVVYAAISFVLGVVRPDVPYPAARRLASVNAEERFDLAVTEDIAAMLRDRPDAFDRVVIYKDNFGVRLEGDASPTTTALAGSYDLFETLGVRPSMGRLFSPEEDIPGRGASTILSDVMWRTRFGADPNILGTTIVLRGFDRLDSYTVVGVLAPGHRFPIGLSSGPDLYLPLGNRHGTEMMQNASVLARLAPGRAHREAASWFGSVAPRIVPDAVPGTRPSIALARYHGADVGGSMRSLLVGVLAAAAFALAVSALNVAMLSWLAALQRAQGFAVRLALGADRWRVRSALLGQCLGPVALGSALGIATAAFLLARLGATVGEGWAAWVPEASLSLAFAAVGIYAVSGGLGALWPTRRILGLDVASTLRRDPGSTSDADERRLRPLVVVQVSVVVALMMLGTLFAAAVDRYVAEDRGFDVTAPTFATVRLGNDISDRDIPASVRDLLVDPALRAAGAALGDPPVPGRITPLPSMVRASVESPPLIGRTWLAAVSAEYWAMVGVELVTGRFFDAAEAALGSRVAVLDTATARELDLRPPVVGRTILVRLDVEWLAVEVVGLVESLRMPDARTGEPIRQVYLPYGLRPSRELRLAIRSPLAASALPSVQRRLPGAVIEPPIALESMVRSTASIQLLASWALRVAAMLALLLALVGLFTVLARATERRRREFGIRLVVGASSVGVAGLALRSGMKLAAVGVAVGATTAVLTAYMLRSVLFGVPPWDVGSLGTTVAVVLVTSGLAILQPAIWAGRSSPADLMRSD
jgi:predicted permease